MKKFPSIEQFRNIIRTVRTHHDYQGRDEQGNPIYSHSTPYPTLMFRGTVKLHGTNAGIVRYSDGRTEFQSRENVLSLEKDNNGFMNAMVSKTLDFLFKGFKFNDYVAVYGEWCGGSIQKGVALSGLPKMFVVFGVKVDDQWVDLPSDLSDNSQGIYNILQFPVYTIDIDFNYPEKVQNKLIDWTIEVENQCPVGAYFGVQGIGEGIVFTALTNQDYCFKSKGEKHSVSKVRKLNAVDTELMDSVNEFVEYAVTENRLKQGLDVLQQTFPAFDSKQTGDFIRWVVTDVLKEEKDTLVDSGLDEKLVKSAIVTKARVWFLSQI